MSTPLTPAKRPHDHDFTELDSKGKLQKSAAHYTQKQPQKSCPEGTVFRVLCPASKIDGVAGEDASALLQISQETGAKVRVEDIVPGCDEGIVVISCPDKEAEVSSEQSKEGGEEAKVIEVNDDRKEFDETSEDKNSDLLEDSTSGKKTASMQKALLLLFERIVESEPKTNGVNEENSKSSSFVLRLLVLSSQVGCILGKAGSVIKQMSAESGAQIRILPRDKLPSCASASDELVQIIGEVDAVRKALQSVSQQLLENPPGDHDSFTSNTTGPSSHTASHPLLRPEMCGRSNHSFSSQGPRDVADFHSGAPPLIQKFREGGIPGRMMPSPEFLTFRLLCPHEKVGGVIGKGGAVVKTLQQDTGCEIKIVEGVSDSEDRIILISGPAHPDDRISPAQDAVLRVQARIIRSAPDNKDKTITAKLIISSNQIGCLLGKGGTIIAQMRKFSGAHIRIMGRDQIPKCASEGEEVVQINGDYEAVQEALLQITTRLRNHFFRDAFPSIHHSSDAAFMHQARPFQPYRREFSPPELYSNLGPPFHKFDPVYGPPPHGGFHTHDDRHLFVHDIHRPGMPPHISERKPWGPQGYTEGAGPIGFPDFAGGPRRRNLGSGGGSQPAIITSTTVEVVVPRSLVPIIYGEDGACLKQIRQISDARVTITEPKPGAAETAIIISGTPEQTHAAQSLIQAFVMSEREST